MIGQIFKVATEFRFEVGSAMIQSNALAGSVDKLSNSADNALLSFQRLGLGMVGSISGASGGMLGIFGAAIKSQEEFIKNQVGIAAAMGKESGTFAERMEFSANKMEQIGKMAQNLGLPGDQLVSFTKSMTPVLKPKLGARAAVNESAELGRLFLKASQTLPISQAYGQDQLQRLIMGTSVAGNDLFTILTQDTQAMAEFAGQGKKFNNLPLTEKLKKLNEAFGQYAGDIESIIYLTNTVSGQFGIMKRQLSGMFSILRPLGATLSGPVVESLKRFNRIISDQLAPMIKNISLIINPWVQDLDRLLTLFMQLRETSKNMQTTGKIAFGVGASMALHHILTKVQVRIPYVTKGLSRFAMVIQALEKDITMASAARGARNIGAGAVRATAGGGIAKLATTALSFIFAGMIKGFRLLIAWGPKLFMFANAIVTFASRFIVPLLVIQGVLEFFSRSFAHFKLQNAGKIAAIFIRLSETMAIFSASISIFDEGFDKLAKWFGGTSIFGGVIWLFEQLANVFGFLVGLLPRMLGLFQGVMFVLLELFEMIKNKIPGMTGNMAFGGDLGAAFEAGWTSMYEKIGQNMERKDYVQQNNTTINGGIKIQNQFKENMEPDRIAFSLVKQLQATAQAPTQGRGQTFTKGSTSKAFGGNSGTP